MIWTGRPKLPEELRSRVEGLHRSWRERISATRSLGLEPLATARFVALDLETTGPRMLEDRIISIGAVVVRERQVVHAEGFEALIRQSQSSTTDNILIHQIGGQQQLGGREATAVLVDFLEFLAESVAVAFRAEFDQTVLEREVSERLGLKLRTSFLDLAALLPGLFPGTSNDSLDDWTTHFDLPPVARHDAVADAYTSAELLMLVLERAQRAGMEKMGDLLEMQSAQRWLGRRR
jgi:DNA polymerase-3 subunit epsilon